MIFLNKCYSVGLHNGFSLVYFGLDFLNTFEKFPSTIFAEKWIYQD